MSRETGRTVKAVQTTLDIVEYLRENEGGKITDIADDLHRSKGTVHSHLATLLENEYVVKDGEAYRLSLRYMDFGQFVQERLGIYDVVQDELDDLAAETGELAQFATEEHGRAVYIYKAHGEKAVQTASTVGKRENLHCISLGKAMLAHMPRSRVEEIVDRHGLPAYTAATITEREKLFADLERVRERGYAVDNEEKIEGLRCIAAPVKGTDGGVLGAVSISGPSSRMDGKRFEEELPNNVKRSANVIEINAKFS
ncbi:IclR family transcriptional regulator [Haladaptatus salinisoli]|uniref:IclR family transcriptional regulator n=1 Tax=Haladaptatus salinisoli TaxID=2884876 RepID=UPI001D0B2C24|nr:IclR family transcriptional regulator [Haladaptatus salinisoli]